MRINLLLKMSSISTLMAIMITIVLNFSFNSCLISLRLISVFSRDLLKIHPLSPQAGMALHFTFFLVHTDTKSVNVTIVTVIVTDVILILKPISAGTVILKHFTLPILNIISLTTINILVSIYLCFLL